MTRATATLDHLLTARLRALPQSERRVFVLPEIPHRPRPVARVHALSDALAIHFAVTVDRTRALRVLPALVLVRTIGLVTSVQTENCYPFFGAFFALAFAEAAAAFFARAVRSSGVIVSSDRFPPIFPPFRPISLMTLETILFFMPPS
jgi:hypothetical protein